MHRLIASRFQAALADYCDGADAAGFIARIESLRDQYSLNESAWQHYLENFLTDDVFPLFSTTDDKRMTSGSAEVWGDHFARRGLPHLAMICYLHSLSEADQAIEHFVPGSLLKSIHSLYRSHGAEFDPLNWEETECRLADLDSDVVRSNVAYRFFYSRYSSNHTESLCALRMSLRYLLRGLSEVPCDLMGRLLNSRSLFCTEFFLRPCFERRKSAPTPFLTN